MSLPSMLITENKRIFTLFKKVVVFVNCKYKNISDIHLSLNWLKVIFTNLVFTAFFVSSFILICLIFLLCVTALSADAEFTIIAEIPYNCFIRA